MKRHFLLLCSLVIPHFIFAQWSCPSQLGGHLRQVGSSGFSWGVEVTGGVGSIGRMEGQSVILNQMSLLGLDYSFDHHTFYAEGGVKTWYQGDYAQRIKSSHNALGLRELFYNNRSSYGMLTVGLQSLRSEDVYLVNERVLGISYKQNFGRFGLNVFGGAVAKQFARNGTFCNLAYLYDILPYINQPLIGEALGQTNMAGATFGFHPAGADGDEFSDDGLGSEAESIRPALSLETIGVALYSEFGSWYSAPSLLAGIYANIELGDGYRIRPEMLCATTGRQALVYIATFEKSIAWNDKHRSIFDAAFYGQTALNRRAAEQLIDETKAVNAFSNILAGTVLRFDTPDMPFCTFSAKHTLPKLKAHLKIQLVSQLNASPNHELDVELGKRFFGCWLINLTYGYISSPALVSNPHLARIEMRFNF
jgi:hypothetical protein